ncbi:MAG TPA: hypothetical protein VG518_09030, partial [Solirubrobacterales bacterium]|nr:hypothetical protein [Solirubrobacterales bacterium]
MNALAEALTPKTAPSLSRRLLRIGVWVGAVAAAIAILDLLGLPVSDWIGDLFSKLGQIPTWAIVAGVLLETAQTSLA